MSENNMEPNNKPTPEETLKLVEKSIADHEAELVKAEAEVTNLSDERAKALKDGDQERVKEIYGKLQNVMSFKIAVKSKIRQLEAYKQELIEEIGETE